MIRLFFRISLSNKYSEDRRGDRNSGKDHIAKILTGERALQEHIGCRPKIETATLVVRNAGKSDPDVSDETIPGNCERARISSYGGDPGTFCHIVLIEDNTHSESDGCQRSYIRILLE